VSVDMLVIAAHPDDAEMAAGGLIAKMVQRGHSVGIVDLTRGEMGTRGTPEERAKESAAADEVLGITVRENLGLPDGGLTDSLEYRRLVVDAIRRHRPALVVAPPLEDLHPDHAAAGRLAAAAHYPTGFTKYETGSEPHRPDAVIHMMNHFEFMPTFIVDVTDVWETKMAAGRRSGRGVPRGGRPVKVGIVCYPTYGGSGAIATELGQVLARRGHDVHVVSYSPPFRLRDFRLNLHYHAVEVSSYPLFRYPPYDLALASKLMEVVQSADLDLLHVHYAIPHSISAYLARQMLNGHPIKIITTLHGTDITVVGTERAYRQITRFGIRQSDGVTVVSRWLHDETARIFGVKREMRVIPNFVDTDRFAPNGSPEFRSRFAHEDEKLIVHASNFRPVKRVCDAVRAFSIIRNEMPSRLALVGDGPELPRAVELAEELGIKRDVIFVGQIESIDALLRVADLFLLPSEYESFGLAALEALSCGTPVIASRSGGLAEVVVEGESGYLVEVGDYREMARRGASLLGDEEKHDRFAAAARESVVSRFPEEEIVSMYEKYYEEVLSGGSSPA